MIRYIKSDHVAVQFVEQFGAYSLYINIRAEDNIEHQSVLHGVSLERLPELIEVLSKLQMKGRAE